MNPYDYAEGNPALNPSYNDNIELGYSLDNTYTGSLYIQKTNKAFTQVVRFHEGVRCITYDNSYNERNIGLNFGYYNNPLRFWEIAINGNLFYTKATSLSSLVLGQNL